MLLVTTTGKCDIVLKCKSICADFTVNIIDYDYHIIEHLDVHHIHVTVLNITIVFVVNIYSKVERPVTLKKEGIQTRNRKLSSKSKKSKRRGGVGGAAGHCPNHHHCPQPFEFCQLHHHHHYNHRHHHQQVQYLATGGMVDFFRTGLEGTYGPFSGGMGSCSLMKRMIIDDSCSDYLHYDADDNDISL